MSGEAHPVRGPKPKNPCTCSFGTTATELASRRVRSKPSPPLDHGRQVDLLLVFQGQVGDLFGVAEAECPADGSRSSPPPARGYGRSDRKNAL